MTGHHHDGAPAVEALAVPAGPTILDLLPRLAEALSGDPYGRDRREGTDLSSGGLLLETPMSSGVAPWVCPAIRFRAPIVDGP